MAHFNKSKKVLSSNQGQIIFKDLTFKTKDFKMCPWGLHLC